MRPDNPEFESKNGRGGTGARVSGGGIQGPWQHHGPSDGSASRRRTGRLPQEALVCNIGLVLDISVGGMRVLSRTPHSGVIKITFRDFPTTEPLLATVTWSKRTGLFMRELGLRFENLTPRTSSMLTTIASCHRFKRAI